jgi:hypothetical protein
VDLRANPIGSYSIERPTVMEQLPDSAAAASPALPSVALGGLYELISNPMFARWRTSSRASSNHLDTTGVSAAPRRRRSMKISSRVLHEQKLAGVPKQAWG